MGNTTRIEIHEGIVVIFDNSTYTKEQIEIFVEEFKKVVNDFLQRRDGK